MTPLKIIENFTLKCKVIEIEKKLSKDFVSDRLLATSGKLLKFQAGRKPKFNQLLHFYIFTRFINIKCVSD